MTTAETIIEHFGLVKHPEGGYFREMYRSGAPTMESMGKTDERGARFPVADVEGAERNEMTSIYWMARGDDECSHLWMGLNVSPHIHYYQSGDPFQYTLIYADGTIEDFVLGPDPAQGHVMQMVVPGRGTYKCGRFVNKTKGCYFLCGEGVSPGFDFRDFKFISLAQLTERIGKGKAEEYRSFLHGDPAASNFDDYYEKKARL